jgi:N-acetylneuraminate synthase
MSQVYIIAEAGVNHNGNPGLAFELIDAAVETGANAIKFQTFSTEKLVSASAGLADYQKKNNDIKTQKELLKNLELDHETFVNLKRYAKSKRIDFLTTAFDLDSFHFVKNKLRLKTLKIPSGELTNAPLLLEFARSKSALILSTGMADISEIKMALGILAFGLLQKNMQPTQKRFREAYASGQGMRLLKKHVSLLHCTSEYPAPFNELNLRAITLLQKKFGLNVGYSDHSEGIVASLGAVTLGATIIEKHFTTNRNLPGPDHIASLEPQEFTAMVAGIRQLESSLGKEIKQIQRSEKKNRDIVRKSIVASSDIVKNEKFTVDNIDVKRPGNGVSPVKYWNTLGKKSKKNYTKGDLI